MKNLLVLTPIYPADDLPKTDTPILHFFAKEWVKMGYNVRVIHYACNFPILLNSLAKPFSRIISSKVGFMIRNNQLQNREYEIDGVYVSRICLTKIIPHSRYRKSEIKRAVDLTLNILEQNQFKPDCIIGHWLNPQLEIIHLLKKKLLVPSVLVLHSLDYGLDTIYKKDRDVLMNSIDIMGYRSKYIKEAFESKFNIHKKSFMCYSGIPVQYIKNITYRDHISIHNFIFVGTLIKRKHPSVLIKSLSESITDKDFTLNYIGVGSEEKVIKQEARKYKVEDKVTMLGRMPKDSVQKYLRQSDIFIMISQNEAFGLVYLEAMAAGCITIASKHEGFDGIIKDGINGFLCNAGDAFELSSIIKRISNMPMDKLLTISRNAIDTAKAMTENNFASSYIRSIEDLSK